MKRGVAIIHSEQFCPVSARISRQQRIIRTVSRSSGMSSLFRNFSVQVTYQSNRSFNIPPRATPRAFEFLENFCSNSPSRGRKAVQIPHHRSIPGDQMPPSPGNYNNNNNNNFISYINIQISHHLQIARLIEAGGVWTA